MHRIIKLKEQYDYKIIKYVLGSYHQSKVKKVKKNGQRIAVTQPRAPTDRPYPNRRLRGTPASIRIFAYTQEHK